jgi:ABC-2 type transport system ATP-binding protein
VALALLGDARVLLLDEPTASLDAGQRRRLWEIVGALREGGGAVVFATQNLEELDRYADRVAVLQRGRLTFDGPTPEWDRLHAEEEVFV